MATKQPAQKPAPDGPPPTDPLPEAVARGSLAPSDAVVLLREYGGAAEWALDQTRHAFTLGSAPGHVDVLIPRPFVSRQHATLRRVAYWLDVTNHSNNGTKFGGASMPRSPVKPGDCFTVGVTTLLALDGFMVEATEPLRRQLGRDNCAAVDAALIESVRVGQPPLVLTGPNGIEPDRLARVIHDVSPRRALPFEILDAKTTRHAIAATLARVGGGTLFVDLRPLRERKVSAALQRALIEAVTPPATLDKSAKAATLPPLPPRVIVSASTVERAHASLDTTAIPFSTIETPAIETRPREIIGLLDELMKESESPVRASHLALDRQEAVSRHPWPANQVELRAAAIRIGAYLASGGNLSAAAKSLGVHHSTLAEALQRIGVLAQ